MAVSPVAALRSSLAVVAVAYLLMASQTVSARPATKRGLLQGPGPSLDSSGLDFNYYATKCPQAQQIVADKVASFAAQFPPGQVTGALLRLIFHDAFVRGGDGSVLIDSTPDNTAEKGALLNFALDPVGFEVVDGIKAALEEACPRTVSCADILALGSREAVFQAGGPHFEVPLGRLDGRVSIASEADANLPNPAMNTSQLIDNFAAKGLNQQDMVVLSGAHTVGITHCASFADRLLPTLDSTYPDDLRAFLQSACNTGLILECFNQVDVAKCLAAGVVDMEENDQNFNAQFDNRYYQRLTEGYGVFTSDVTLFRDPRTQGLVQQFAQDQASWFTAFTASLLDMARIGVQLAPEGTRVRTNCRVVDS